MLQESIRDHTEWSFNEEAVELSQPLKDKPDLNPIKVDVCYPDTSSNEFDPVQSTKGVLVS